VNMLFARRQVAWFRWVFVWRPRNGILRAARFAGTHHSGQVRKSLGTPYIAHPERIANAVSQYDDSTEVEVMAAWLHDVVEDCGVSVATIERLFGPDVALLVDELTNRSKESNLPRGLRKKMDRERLRGVSRWAKRIKMLDRMDNLSEVVHLEHSFIKIYLQETIQLLQVIEDADMDLASLVRSRVDAIRAEVLYALTPDI